MRRAMSDEDRPNPLDVEADRLRRKLRLIVNNEEEPDPEFCPEACGIDPAQDWKNTLIQKRDRKTGEIEYFCRAYNIIQILQHDPQWAGRIRQDDFRQCMVLDDEPIKKHTVFEIKAWLEKNWIAGEVKTSVLKEALEAVAVKARFHRVREWLNSLHWDGTDRIATFFPDYCGTPNSPYTQGVARALFISAVARIITPGCKVDLMVILEGEQGAGKTQLILTLFSPDWHLEIMYDPGSLDFCQALRGKWCAEFGELAAMSKADENRVKQTLTQVQDTYRPSYGFGAETFKRQNIFMGTTNRSDWGRDDTGGRRYLPVLCADINIEAVAANRDQLWAEAVQLFHSATQTREQWWLIPGAKEEQDARYQSDSWEDYIIPFLAHRTKVTISEILSEALFIKAERHGRSEQTRVGSILRRLKWTAKQETTGERRRFYVKSTT